MAEIKATTCLASAPPPRRPLPSRPHSCRQPVIVPSQSCLGSPAIPASAAQLQIEQSPWVGFLCTLAMISGKAVALSPCRCGGSCLLCAWAWEKQTPGTPEREKQRQKRKNVFLSILGAHIVFFGFPTSVHHALRMEPPFLLGGCLLGRVKGSMTSFLQLCWVTHSLMT